MAEWKVEIELFNTTHRITVPADTEGEALHLVKNKLWSITKVKIEKVDDTVEFLKSMFNMR